MKRIGFVVSLEVADRLEKLAAHQGLSMTAVLQGLVLGARIKRGRCPVKKKKKAS